MKHKNKLKNTYIILGLLALFISGIAVYLINMPHRNIQSSATDYTLKATQIVDEYLADPKKANEKYLDNEGDSKIIEVNGLVNKIYEDFNKNKVVLLQPNSEKAGVSCTFSKETNSHIAYLRLGAAVLIKGVIRSGASYDADLKIYEDVIMEKCDVIRNK